jgi:DNA mismatch repair protein MutS
VREGAADRSYGLHVAALAGVPKAVIRQAQARLADLERRQPAADQADSPQMPLFQAAPEHPAVSALDELDPDGLSPREALAQLYALKALAQQELHS